MSSFRLLFLSALFVTQVSFAQDAAPEPAEESPTPAATPSPKPKREHPKVAPFETVDESKDGSISEEEFSAHVVIQTFEFHNTDQDNAIQEAEAKKHARKATQATPEPAAPDASPTPARKARFSAEVAMPFAKADSNSNGQLTREELKAVIRNNRPQFQTVFQLLDTSKDGKLSADEWTKYADQQAKSGGGVPIFRFSF